MFPFSHHVLRGSGRLISGAVPSLCEAENKGVSGESRRILQGRTKKITFAGKTCPGLMIQAWDTALTEKPGGKTDCLIFIIRNFRQLFCIRWAFCRLFS